MANPPKEYLEKIRFELMDSTDDWTDAQLDEYAYGLPSRFADAYAAGLSPRDAVHEEINSWEPGK